MENNNGELAVVEQTTTPTPLPQFEMVDVEGAEAFMKNYQDVVKALLDDNDVQDIGGKEFKKKSAWRKLATAFRISDEIINEDIVRDETNQIVSAKYYVRAILPNGRSSVGVGVCSIYDKIRYKKTQHHKADKETPSNFELRGRFSNAEHDVPSTAHSRAKNRAIADLIGAGEVSAEEMETPKKVQRASRDAEDNEEVPVENSKKEESKKSKGRGRRTRTRSKPKVEEEDTVVLDEVIETKAEVVTNDAGHKSKSFKELAEVSSAIRKAINKLQEDPVAVINKDKIIDTLLTLFDLGKITLDEYDEAKDLLSNN